MSTTNPIVQEVKKKITVTFAPKGEGQIKLEKTDYHFLFSFPVYKTEPPVDAIFDELIEIVDCQKLRKLCMREIKAGRLRVTPRIYSQGGPDSMDFISGFCGHFNVRVQDEKFYVPYVAAPVKIKDFFLLDDQQIRSVRQERTLDAAMLWALNFVYKFITGNFPSGSFTQESMKSYFKDSCDFVTTIQELLEVE